jgi:hypothetical protein
MPKTLVSTCQIVLYHIPGGGNVCIQWWLFDLLFVWTEWRGKLRWRGALCLHPHTFSVGFENILNDWGYEWFSSTLNVPGRYIVVRSLHDRLSSGHAITTAAVHSAGRSASLPCCYYTCCGPGSIVGIETGYGQDGPGMESGWGRDFPHLSRPALGLTQLPV